MPGGVRHRHGALHQHNKPFKGGSGGQRAAKNAASQAGGRVGHVLKPLHGKTDRKVVAALRRKESRAQALASRRLAARGQDAPRLVAVVALTPGCDTFEVIRVLGAEVPQGPGAVSFALVKGNQRGKVPMAFFAPARELFPTLDSLLVADIVLFVVRPGVEIDSLGDAFLSGGRAQGMPSTVGIVQGLQSFEKQESDAVKLRAQNDAIRLASRTFVTELGSGVKCFAADTVEDGEKAVRVLGTMIPREVSHRSRPNLCALSWEWSQTGESVGILGLTGWLRGSLPLSPNDLVHISSVGTFQLHRVLAGRYPEVNKGDEMEERVLGVPDERQETLGVEAVPSFDEWPTDEEIERAERERTRAITERLTDLETSRLVPAGFNSYQASWIPPDDVELTCKDDSDDGMASDVSFSGDEVDERMEEEAGDPLAPVSDPRTRMTVEERDRVAASRKAEAEWRAREEDEGYPDELDTPMDQFAHVRFARYRGLRSTSRCSWDVNEALPRDYGRIYRFEDVRATEKAVREEAEQKPITVGQCVRLEVKDFPASAVSAFCGCPVSSCRISSSSFAGVAAPWIVSGLLQHEQRVTVVHCAVATLPNEVPPPMRSGRQSSVVLQYGWRRFVVHPLLSEDSPSATAHRMERFFGPTRRSILSAFAPLHFGPGPALVFSTPSVEDPAYQLIATGGVYGKADPDRVVLKRIVLTGYPVKIYKRTAIIRYLFLYPEDVKWFKPVQLITKNGRQGHIVEPVGTHGRMRCRFDAHIKSQDTVCMNLYKRVFPKWGSVPFVPRASVDDGIEAVMKEDGGATDVVERAES